MLERSLSLSSFFHCFSLFFHCPLGIFSPRDGWLVSFPRFPKNGSSGCSGSIRFPFAFRLFPPSFVIDPIGESLPEMSFFLTGQFSSSALFLQEFFFFSSSPREMAIQPSRTAPVFPLCVFFFQCFTSEAQLVFAGVLHSPPRPSVPQRHFSPVFSQPPRLPLADAEAFVSAFLPVAFATACLCAFSQFLLNLSLTVACRSVTPGVRGPL